MTVSHTGLPATRAAEAYDEIKRRIIELELRPGATFTEAEISGALSLSKTPAREALARLYAEGFVRVYPRAGYRVSAVTLKRAQDLFDLRSLLESEAAARAATRASTSGERLRELQARQELLYDPADRVSVRRFLKANTEFHVGLVALADNDGLTDAVARVLDELQRMFHVGITLSSSAGEVAHQHHDLLDAVLSGDPERARNAAKAQVASARQFVLDALMSSEVILSANVAPLTTCSNEHP